MLAPISDSPVGWDSGRDQLYHVEGGTSLMRRDVATGAVETVLTAGSDGLDGFVVRTMQFDPVRDAMILAGLFAYADGTFGLLRVDAQTLGIERFATVGVAGEVPAVVSGLGIPESADRYLVRSLVAAPSFAEIDPSPAWSRPARSPRPPARAPSSRRSSISTSTG
ncbi:MAG: hypothetical protein R3F20_15985 [Planctomycetota bacterium]